VQPSSLCFSFWNSFIFRENALSCIDINLSSNATINGTSVVQSHKLAGQPARQPTFLYRLQEINKGTIKQKCNDMNVVGLVVKIAFTKTVKGKQTPSTQKPRWFHVSFLSYVLIKTTWYERWLIWPTVCQRLLRFLQSI
jgi:hypothetical protein